MGYLFQSVMNKTERRKAGAHYTTEQNLYVFGVRNNNGQYNAITGAGAGIYPYSGLGLLAAVGSIIGQALFGANSATDAVANGINQFFSEPGGVDRRIFSGGAQAFATASLGGMISTPINSVTYLSPGLGFGSNLPVGPVAGVYSGSGIIDGLATLNARLAGVSMTSTGL